MDIVIDWDPSSGVSTYQVEYKLHSGSTWTVAGTTASNLFEIDGLTDCTAYDFRITPNCVNSTTGAPTITSNFFTQTGSCSGAKFDLNTTNALTSSNNINITSISSDLGNTTTVGMPVTYGNNSTYSADLASWFTTNFILNVKLITTTVNTHFTIQLLRNGTLEGTSAPFYPNTTDTPIPVSLLLPPNNTDILTFILTT